MVEHHLGQQQQGEEPEGAAESTGTQETCPPGATDTEAESRLSTSGKAQSTSKLQAAEGPGWGGTSLGGGQLCLCGEGSCSSQKLSSEYGYICT